MKIRATASIMPGLVVNCLTGRVKQKAFSIALKLLEADKKGLVLEEITKGLK
jgi:hypothetical protein